MLEEQTNHRLRLVHVRADRRSMLPIRPTLKNTSVETVQIDRFGAWGGGDATTIYVIDVNLRDEDSVKAVRLGLGDARLKRSVFVLDRGNRPQEIQALAMGASALLIRPIDAHALEVALRGLAGVHASGDHGSDRNEEASEEPPTAIAAGTMAMSALFDGFRANLPPAPTALTNYSRDLDDEVDSVGLDRWIATVRNYHRGTYQHSLLVSGIASRFGAALGLSATERQVLTAAALVHDIGKIRISTELLDKIGPLNDAEFAVVKRHPEIGAAFLMDAGLDPRIVTAVRHHHEYLDGTGYPDGLKGAGIPSLVRLLTISDIFGALVEQRSYKLPLAPGSAYRRLESMADEGKLDQGLVRAFRPAAAEVTTTQVTVAMPRLWVGREGIHHG